MYQHTCAILTYQVGGDQDGVRVGQYAYHGDTGVSEWMSVGDGILFELQQ